MTTKAEVLKSIRAKCLDCSCYQDNEIKFCPITQCALFPFRFGKDPNPAKGGTFGNRRVTPKHAVQASPAAETSSR